MEIKIVWRRNCKHEHEAVKRRKKEEGNFHLDEAGWCERWAMVESIKEKAASGFTLAAHSCYVCVCARENNEKNEKKRWKFFVSVEGFFFVFLLNHGIMVCLWIRSGIREEVIWEKGMVREVFGGISGVFYMILFNFSNFLRLLKGSLRINV